MFAMLGQGLLEYFTRESSFLLVVVYDTVTKGRDFEEAHTHEESDTLIPHQVLASVSTVPCVNCVFGLQILMYYFCCLI